MAKKIIVPIEAKDNASATINKFTSNTQQQFDKLTTGATSAFKKLAGIAGIGAVSVAFSSLIKNTISYADQLGKLKDRLGINVQEFDKIRQIAAKSSVSFETLTMATQRMTRRLAEGTSTVKDAIKELGLSMSGLKNLTPDKQLLVLLQALDKVEDGGRRVALAFQLFDSEGVKLLQLVPSLRSGLADITSNFDAEKTKLAEDFGNKMEYLRETFKQLAVNIIPFLNKSLDFLIENLNAIATILGGILSLKILGWFIAIVGSVGVVGKSIGVLTNLFKVFGNVIKSIGLASFLKLFTKFSPTITQASAATGIWLTRLQSIVAVLSNPIFLAIATTIAAITIAWNAESEATKKAKEELIGFNNELLKLSKIDLLNKIHALESKQLQLRKDLAEGAKQGASLAHRLTPLVTELESVNSELSLALQQFKDLSAARGLPSVSIKKEAADGGTTDDEEAKQRALFREKKLYIELLKLTGYFKEARIREAQLEYEELKSIKETTATELVLAEQRMQWKIKLIEKEFYDKRIDELMDFEQKRSELIRQFNNFEYQQALERLELIGYTYQRSLDITNNHYNNMIEDLDKITEKQKELALETSTFLLKNEKNTLEDMERITKEYNDNILKIDEKYAKAKEAIEQNRVVKLKQLGDEESEIRKKQQEEGKKQLTFFENLKLVSDAITNSFPEELTGAYKVLGKFVELTLSLEEPLTEAADTIKTTFSDAFSDFIVGAMSAKDAWREFVNSMLAGLSKIFTNYALQGLFGMMGQSGGGLLSSGLGSIFGGLFKGGTFGGGLPSTGPYIPGMANGGTAVGGRPILVGERGPELFVPGQTGSVIPNGKMGSTININNNIEINKPSSQAEGQQYGAIIARQIKEQVKAAMADEMRYGGVLNRQTGGIV